MTMRTCLECGTPCLESRCDEHKLKDSRPKPAAATAAYDAQWRRLSAQARRLQPFCSDCGTTEDLQADHSVEAWERRERGLAIRLEDIEVVCGPCNRRRGAARGANVSRPGGVTRRLDADSPRRHKEFRSHTPRGYRHGD